MVLQQKRSKLPMVWHTFALQGCILFEMCLRCDFAPHRHAQEHNPPCHPFNPHPWCFFRRYKIVFCRVNPLNDLIAFLAQHGELRPLNAFLAQYVVVKSLPLTLYEDPHLLVVLKPAGLAVHGKGIVDGPDSGVA